MPAKEKKKEREHALLSASSSHKWLNCPPSARLENEMPDTSGTAAKEGTLAHAICELKLQKVFTDQNMSTRTYNIRLKKLQSDELYAPEMERFTDAYVEKIKETAFSMSAPPTVMVEERVDYGNWAPEGFGTADCIMIQGDNLHIFDFKYGKGVPVTAECNMQLILYALGTVDKYGFIFPIKQIHLHIIQPRLDNFSDYETDITSLLTIGKDIIRPKAELAFEGKGEFRQGAWCDSCFCKLSGTCRCRADENMKLMADAMDSASGKVREPAVLSAKEVGEVLKKAQFLKKWVEKLEKYALDTMVSGGVIPGWKLIEGRSNRCFTDTEAAMQAVIQSGYDRSLLYEEKAISLTELEKTLDKDTWNAVVSPFVMKPPGKPTIAPADDKRPSYSVKPSAEEAFGGANKL